MRGGASSLLQHSRVTRGRAMRFVAAGIKEAAQCPNSQDRKTIAPPTRIGGCSILRGFHKDCCVAWRSEWFFGECWSECYSFFSKRCAGRNYTVTISHRFRRQHRQDAMRRANRLVYSVVEILCARLIHFGLGTVTWATKIYPHKTATWPDFYIRTFQYLRSCPYIALQKQPWETQASSEVRLETWKIQA